jgi:ankyrin
MSLKRVLGGCAAVLVLAIFARPGLIAADHTVADFAMIGDTAAIQALLAQHADINAPQADGTTALHWAVSRNDSALAKLLIDAGANVRAANRDGATPLSLAATAGNAEMIATLIGAGAGPNEKLPFGKTALMLAARSGNPAALTVLLDHGADVNAKEDLRGTTALMWAADEEHPDAVKLLIEHGADVKARSAAAARGRGPALARPATRERTGLPGGCRPGDAAARRQGQAAAGQTPFEREGPAEVGS